MKRPGALPGLLAALATTLVMLLLRVVLGVPLPFELVSDRFLPFVPVEGFVTGLGVFGGALLAKQIGFYGSFLGQLLIGVALGGLFVRLLSRGRGAGAAPLTRRAIVVTFGAAAAVWLVTVVVLWPALRSNYGGLPPERAALLSAAGLLVLLGVFAASLLGAYAALREQARS